ncbi:hypothetical protein SY27_08200 [Flavobacterium sp. 316]|uniref:Tetratricopeptide repeat protein n=1 Tax=Flavobacterium sediminilitoris TaxID=2024526 RepID=A0ABY4HTH8_9FLAO|nr:MULTISPECIES: hypothetical protein [Flavobacterium]KIX21663.1 hypothetical protein SY27_08200 [Flavobacterium sp. 316]UOX35476.1 hypothetical protein LXD69_08125 [Flavobacterium sediminilitoris]
MKKNGLQYLIVFLLFLNSHNLSSQSLNDTFDNIYLKELNFENIALKERIKNFPDDAKMLNSRIAQELRDKDYTSALQLTITLDSILPNNADVKNFKGKMYYKLNNIDSALTSFDEAIQLDGTNKWFYLNKAGLLSDTNMYYKALQTIEDLLKIAPNWGIAYNSKAILLLSFNQDEEAMLNYNIALEKEPKSAQILTNRGDLFLKMRNKKQAILDYKKALEVQPDYIHAKEQLELLSK